MATTRTPRRRLGDLWQVGEECTIDDGAGPVTVWLHKLNTPEREECYAYAGAARARLLAAAADPASPQRDYTIDALRRLDRDMVVRIAMADEVEKRQQSIRAELELSDRDGWAKDDYLNGLRTAWSAGERPLSVVFAENPSDPEAVRVDAELRRFEDELQRRVDAAADDLRFAYQQMPDAELYEQAAGRHLQARANQAWDAQCALAQLWCAVREPDDHKVRYFSSPEEVRALPDEVRDYLLAAYTDLLVGDAEGKDSPAEPASSPPSAPPAEEETEPSSGLTAVPA